MSPSGSARAWAALRIGLIAGAGLQCSSRERAPSFVLPSEGQSGSGGGTSNGGLRITDAGLDANLCGDQEIPAIADPPNLYFIVDRSASMSDPVPGAASKYEAARLAIGVMLRAVGHRVNYGVAVFPPVTDPDSCTAGAELFPTEAGDPPSYALKGENGPVLHDLLTRLGRIAPSGGTPTSATLEDLESTVFGLGGKTFAVLMTDGAPNCRGGLSCVPDQCIPNIEHDTIGTKNCAAPFNCCDPQQVGAGSPVGYCVDSDATVAAVAAYEAAGIDTYVVGMPGSEAYSALLGRVAAAGHTARAGTTPYYAVTDTAELTLALKAIGAQVAISCSLPLAAQPDDVGYVNVYFDGQAVPFDASDGWQWASDQTSIEFVGSACDTLSSGNVLNVQVLGGCKTVVR